MLKSFVISRVGIISPFRFRGQVDTFRADYKDGILFWTEVGNLGAFVKSGPFSLDAYITQ